MTLSANSILQQGRYRIIGSFAKADSYTLYDAYDNLLGNKIVIHESVIHLPKVVSAADRSAISTEFASRVKQLSNMRHDGIVRVRDGFSEVDKQYLVTEPVESNYEAKTLVGNPVESITRLLSAVQCLVGASGGQTLEIGPGRLRMTPDGNNRLLFFGYSANAAADQFLSRYQPLELVFDNLDAASRKAILNGYDDDAIAVLESKPDARSAIFALAASIFRVISGEEPFDALERSVTLLDGKTDLFKSQLAGQDAIPKELHPFFERAMAMRREDRFPDGESAAGALPAKAAVPPMPVAKEPVAPLPPPKSAEPVKVTSPSPKAAPVAAPVAAAPATAAPTPEFSLANSVSQPRSSGRMFAIVGAAIVVVIGVIVWAFLSFGSGNDAASAAPANPSTSTSTETAPTSIEQPAPQPSPQPALSEQPSTTSDLKATAQAADPQKQKPAQTEQKPAQRAEQKPEQKPANKPKKAVTVDDLISDN